MIRPPLQSVGPNSPASSSRSAQAAQTGRAAAGSRWRRWVELAFIFVRSPVHGHADCSELPNKPSLLFAVCLCPLLLKTRPAGPAGPGPAVLAADYAAVHSVSTRWSSNTFHPACEPEQPVKQLAGASGAGPSCLRPQPRPGGPHRSSRVLAALQSLPVDAPCWRGPSSQKSILDQSFPCKPGA